jgi:hypothetical protein
MSGTALAAPLRLVNFINDSRRTTEQPPGWPHGTVIAESWTSANASAKTEPFPGGRATVQLTRPRLLLRNFGDRMRSGNFRRDFRL